MRTPTTLHYTRKPGRAIRHGPQRWSSVRGGAPTLLTLAMFPVFTVMLAVWLPDGYGKDRTRGMADDTLGCTAAQCIKDAMMAGGGHTYEVNVKFDGNVHNRFYDVTISKHDRRQRSQI